MRGEIKVFQNIDVMNKALDANMLRYSMLTNNIANAETVGYKRQDVKFQDVLAKQVETKGINKVDIAELDPVIYTDDANYSSRLDGNNVDIDQETSELSKTKLRYDVLIERTNSQLSRYKYILQNIK